MAYVPVVDISADPDAVGAELDEICRAVGFFQVTGHGIPDGIAERAWVVATEFFDLPLEDKLAVARPGADYPYGYMPLAGGALDQRPVALDPAPGGRPARSLGGHGPQAEHAVLPERQLVRDDLVPADLPRAGRTTPLRTRARRAAPDEQVPQIRHLPRKRMIAAASALAISCWKRAEISRAASVAFLMFPHSTRTLGTVVRLSPARSSR